MDTHCERVLQQIAFGYVVTPSGRMRKMYNHEMISLAREACDQLGIAYSGGACDQPHEVPQRAPRMRSPVSEERCARSELENNCPFPSGPSIF
jgi:hypothetical protein